MTRAVVGTAPAGRDSAVRAAALTDRLAVLAAYGSTIHGLGDGEAALRLARYGPNAVRGRRAHPWRVLGRQVRSPLLLLLFATALVSAFVGDAVEAAIIALILIVSVGLGFVNEFRAERAADALHDRLRHSAVVLRGGRRLSVDVTELVPGDVVLLTVGSVVPADLRLLEVSGLSCDESIVTGEARAVAKTADPVEGSVGIGDLRCCALMGTVVHTGEGSGVVVATGAASEFGKIAVGLGLQEPPTEFQRGLARFSTFLLLVALILTTAILVVAVALGRPLLESLLFSLAIAVGITPQLLPAVVSTSLAAGSRVLAQRRVLVKRLVCIEDLGDLDLLVTDKTGTLTTGRIEFDRAVPLGETTEEDLVVLGLLSTEADPEAPDLVGLDALDSALWASAGTAASSAAAYHRLAVRPFDHETRRVAALVTETSAAPIVVVKGAPESVLPLCSAADPGAGDILAHLYAVGARVVAVGSREAPGRSDAPFPEDGLTLRGFLAFVDGVKADARSSLDRLAGLGVEVKVATGDSAVVAERVCSMLGMTSRGTLTGDAMDGLGDDELATAARQATIFARVSPEQKARLIRALRQKGRAVGFLGDGVNDALALHRADVGISVDTAVDVAKDAADVLLLDKDLGVLADGVTEGRRIFANTIKYVLMGTSSNFGNMFSASAASVVIPFLPMLPGQILLNNLLYDSSQLAIPTDRADPEQLRAPAHWDIGTIRRFMLLFGPISSLFDFATFWLMLAVFHAAPSEFRSGWFIESIATQTLIVFAIRTRRVPFIRSRPSLPLAVAVVAVVAIGCWLPYSPLAGLLGFAPLPPLFFLALVGLVLLYLVLVELGKAFYYARLAEPVEPTARRRTYRHRVARRAARFTVRTPHRP
ncbi:magnesium-translocating P-type ATPase [Leifsonia sp. LS1]|uniref:magnesium-translocating P-type ATPase n=1 Tax=Leifsonia sp. LS1 TaxID=2828483 RepID=UPI001CFC4E41|nr:magnesium-translocating P-type ATPase [Leifsonia sp. LS1]GIT81780.1 magnesium-translocating P-type ATPase [Leifsonia sp. LS1]